jgi:hypothetical protein
MSPESQGMGELDVVILAEYLRVSLKRDLDMKIVFDEADQREVGTAYALNDCLHSE